MTDKLQIVLLLMSIALILGVIEMIRRGRIRGHYSVVWLASCAAFLLLALFPPMIGWLAGALGVIDPPNALFMVAIVFIFLLLVEFSAIVTHLHRINRELIKNVALLTWRLEQLEAEGKRASYDPD